MRLGEQHEQRHGQGEGEGPLQPQPRPEVGLPAHRPLLRGLQVPEPAQHGGVRGGTGGGGAEHAAGVVQVGGTQRAGPGGGAAARACGGGRGLSGGGLRLGGGGLARGVLDPARVGGDQPGHRLEGLAAGEPGDVGGGGARETLVGHREPGVEVARGALAALDALLGPGQRVHRGVHGQHTGGAGRPQGHRVGVHPAVGVEERRGRQGDQYQQQQPAPGQFAEGAARLRRRGGPGRGRPFAHDSPRVRPQRGQKRALTGTRRPHAGQGARTAPGCVPGSGAGPPGSGP